MGSYSSTSTAISETLIKSSIPQALKLVLPDVADWRVEHTHRLHGSSFSGLPYRILSINHKTKYYGA